MPKDDHTDAAKNSDGIKDQEATDRTPRGGVHGRKDDGTDEDAPPPLPS